jgi:hypothetical protein
MVVSRPVGAEELDAELVEMMAGVAEIAVIGFA